MTEHGRWNGHKFMVSSKLVRGFSDLQIKGSSEIEDKDNAGQKYVSRKNGKPTEISLTIHLNAYTGCSVRKEAMAFIEEAKDGKTDYFYVGNKKLATCQLMLTDATVKEIEIAHNGTWVKANVSLTMKQCSKNDGTTATVSSGGGTKVGSAGGGSAKASVKTSTPTVTKPTNTALKSADNTAKMTATVAKVTTTTAVKVISSALSVAKKYTAAKKTAVSAAKSAIKKIARNSKGGRNSNGSIRN